MKRGAKLFTDRDYVIHEMPELVSGLPFLRTSIERVEAEVTQAGTLYALTPTARPKASSQETALQHAGFAKVGVPEAQLFPGEINRMSLYRKDAKRGERFRFSKAVLLIMAPGTEARLVGLSAFLVPVDARTEPPVIITEPGPEFQDDARPGAMILGMDRTPKGRIWGLWTGTGDKADGYFILATSDDGGSTWSKPRLVVGALDPTGKRHRAALVGNLWTDPLGRLWLFFDQTVVGIPGPRADWFIRCDHPDVDKPVWSKPVCFSDEGSTLNKPTVLSNGDWLLPVSKWADKVAWVYASTDQGQSWKPRGNVTFPHWNFDEHMMVELRDGRLWMLARTSENPYESFSTDHGVTWSAPQLAATVKNIDARFFLRRLAPGRILLVKNGSPAERLRERSHLSAYLSEDEGQTWKGGLVLDERAAVSYPDGFEAPDGLIHILYDWNRHTDAEILLAKFREEDVLAGKLVSPDAKLRMLANKATGPKPLLDNGIELPYEWPPAHLDSGSTAPMPVPYLRRPPKSIPIDLGRQLFVDDFLIEKTDLKRTFHQAEKHPGNPVFKAETAEEIKRSGSVYLGHGGVFFDPAEEVFKMFYLAGMRGGLAMATSKDLIHWTRPELGLAGGNRLLPPGPEWTGPELQTAGTDNCVWLDLHAKTPAERIKFLTCWAHVPANQRPKGFHHSLHVSGGRTWSPGRPTGMAEDYCSFFFNPFRGVWVFSIKQGLSRGRCRFYHESRDFLAGADWSKSVYWTNADRLDLPEPEGGYPGAGEPTQLYSLSAVAYESVLLGMHMILRGPRNEICHEGKYPKLSDLELGFSRDGFHWDRPDRRPFIGGSRKEGTWDRAYIHTTAGVCLILNDKLWFPYTGFSGVSPDGTRGMYCGGSIGMATLRRDGFASMDAGEKSGSLTTRPLTFKGEHLFVNLDAPRGELRVEVLDEAGHVIAPFTAEHCVALRGDTTRELVRWREAPSLAAVRGQKVRLRFTLSNGSLYSFWITADSKGASHGYLGAGGPGFNGTLDR